MTTVDLITGFLGSGKTTFMKKYVRFLMERGENVCILENDFGAVNVDAMLLHGLYEDGCVLGLSAYSQHPEAVAEFLSYLGVQ